MYLGQGEYFNLTTEPFEKVQYLHNQTIKNGLNKQWIKEALLRVWSNEDLILYEGDSNLQSATIFFNVHIINSDYAKFLKKFDSRTMSRKLP